MEMDKMDKVGIRMDRMNKGIIILVMSQEIINDRL